MFVVTQTARNRDFFLPVCEDGSRTSFVGYLAADGLRTNVLRHLGKHGERLHVRATPRRKKDA